jgi:hypothetical protein
MGVQIPTICNACGGKSGKGYTDDPNGHQGVITVRDWHNLAIKGILNDIYAQQPTSIKKQSPKNPSRIVRNSARDAMIVQRYASGETLEELARVFGISHQRVHQIIVEQRNRQASA